MSNHKCPHCDQEKEMPWSHCILIFIFAVLVFFAMGMGMYVAELALRAESAAQGSRYSPEYYEPSQPLEQ